MKFFNLAAITQCIVLLTSTTFAIPTNLNQGHNMRPKVSFSTCSCSASGYAPNKQTTSCKNPNFSATESFATMTPNTKNMFAKNKQFVSTFTSGDLPLPPSKKLAVVTCIDARIDPNSAFGIQIGDAHVIRNAGGNSREAMRSIVISQQLLGTEELWIIKHKGCGMTTFNETQGRQAIEKNLGVDASELEFLTFPDPNQAVKDDLEFLRSSPLIPKNITLSGFVYNTFTGEVENIV